MIGLVNNMQPVALHRTEAQFARLLQDASTGMLVRLRCFAPQAIGSPHYEPIDALWNSQLDGLIVTGAEPQANGIEDEPLWPLLSRITDWAAANTNAAMFSCLAAHTAVYRLSGVQRRRLPTKLSGVYTCERTSAHALTNGAPARWPVPHSRHNDLDPAALQDAGYQILSEGPGLDGHQGADSFTITAGRSQLLLLQGHPEYSADSLFLEYRRDLRRCLHGQRPDWPQMPLDYFDIDTEHALRMLQMEAGDRPPDEIMAEFATRIATLPAARWQRHGTTLFVAWLNSLLEQCTGHRQTLALAAS